MANRNLSGSYMIQDALLVHCVDGQQDLWYLNVLDAYVHSLEKIQDIAYNPIGDRTYVIFEGDNHLYAFDGLSATIDSKKKINLVKGNASMKIETFWTTRLELGEDDALGQIFLDFQDPDNWNIRLYGRYNGKDCVETWKGNPSSGFNTFNNIIFGDSMFSEGQLRFHNMAKNKDMLDILDIYEVDGSYYGLFKDNIDNRYVVFKTSDEQSGSVIHKLPYHIVVPRMFRTIDDLYSLYVVVKTNEGKVGLQEISVPDKELYSKRFLDLQGLMETSDKMEFDEENPLEIYHLMMDSFVMEDPDTFFLALTSEGLVKFFYRDNIKRISIDQLNEYKELLEDMLEQTILNVHLEEFHDTDGYFKSIKGKVNQTISGFNVFDLLPTEFGATQDIGVIPDSKVDDTDTYQDHRFDSVQVSTDIVQADGMFATSETNPGIVSAAVSNPATTYDDDFVFVKSQRNPLTDGTEFYDYIYDTDGNTLMDLYQVPFIYQVNTNNTYDLYINIPTTRTKYLNRISGTLKSDLTTQVLPGDQKSRVNFLGESLPNNLDESTTRLRVYIDRKFISVGNVELVEISGNSIPLQIYRDSGANNGLYDSIALESRWNGEVVEINEPSKDINKVMLEFECYGTDSQSIHI